MKLVIVESPAKCKKIESYLGNNYKCVASFGHIREFYNGLQSIDTFNNYTPKYKLMPSKKKYIDNLRKSIKKADEIILATDDDREGEAIAWHICKSFNLPPDKTKRIIFHEITKKAIKNAVKNYTYIDMDKVYSQQARQILDLIVGYKLSPLLCKYLSGKGGLSAGRCQTPALRLVYENHIDIKENNKVDKYYETTASFFDEEINFKLNHKFKDENKVSEFLEESVYFDHTFLDTNKKNIHKKSPFPFTTSKLQQNASNMLNYSPKKTMRSAQILYENGYITYMRTDSATYSKDFIEQTTEYIKNNYGEKYLNTNCMALCNKNNSKDKDDLAQNAHEAIRPTNINTSSISIHDKITNSEVRLYSLIYKNSLASLMADAIYSKLTVKIKAPIDYVYVHDSEKPIFDGWKRIYEGTDNKTYDFLLKKSKNKKLLLKYNKINSNITVKNLKHRFTEAKLIQQLEKKGIGRPSTYSSLIDKIQLRGYVKKMDVEGINMKCLNYELIRDELEEKEEICQFGNEKSKLVIQDAGLLVIEFLLKYFIDIFQYDYTKIMENQLDNISNGDKKWYELCRECDTDITTIIKNVDIKQIKNNNKISLGTYKDNPVDLKTGRYGKYITYNKKNISLKGLNKEFNEISLEDVIPYLDNTNSEKNNDGVLGKYKDNDVVLKTGRYGNYIVCNGKNISLKGLNKEFNEINLEDVIPYLDGSKNTSNSNILKVINENMSVRMGKYGKYVYYKTKSMTKPKFIKVMKSLTINDIDEDWVMTKI